MQQLTPQGQQFIQDLSQRYGVGSDAVITLLYAVLDGHGRMAQFSHSELGGSGQWMQGGMTMIGDMFNGGLKSKVDGLCVEIAHQLINQPGIFQAASRQAPAQASNNAAGVSLSDLPAAVGQWWPADLGAPSSSGAQNSVRYAVFPASRRIAVELSGETTVYDTQDHQIGGVSQQQGSNDSLAFSSQYGAVNLSGLPVVSVSGHLRQTSTYAAPPAWEQHSETQPSAPLAPPPHDVFAKIERLADLWQRGILTEQEFSAKKTELLGQI